MAVSGGPNIVDDGLVLYLDAANPSSYPRTGTTWNSLVGSEFSGSLVNGPTYNGLNCGNIVFDGSNDRGLFNTPVNSGSNQTYEIWVRGLPSPSALNGFAYILHNNANENIIGTSFMTIGYAGSVLQTNEIFAVFAGDYTKMGTGVIGNSTSIRQIVLTWNGALQTVYVDGLRRNSQSLAVTPVNHSSVTSFADFRDSTYRPISGSIYVIRAYNRALNEQEVLQNYNAVRSRFGA